VTPGGAAVSANPERAGRLAAAETEHVLARAGALFRVGGVLEVLVIVVTSVAGGHRADPAMWILATAIAAEGTAVCVLLLRARRITTRVAVADLLFVCTVLVLDGAAGVHQHDRIYLTYSFSIIASMLFGISPRRLRHVLAATALLALAYTAQWHLRHGFGAPNVATDAVTYVPNLVVAWAVARHMRRSGKELDASRARVAELAMEQERTRHARILHDHVLQTIESLVQQEAIADKELALAVANDAAWLRSLVQGAPIDEHGDLLSRLQDLAQRRSASGLRVEFNASDLIRASARPVRRAVPLELTEAVASAVGEALTNTAKHAGVSTAVLRATLTDRELTVSLLDRGTGFDPTAVTAGVGLRESITARIEEVGGRVRIESAPGEGTYVELVVQIPDQPGPDRAPALRPA